MMLHGRCAVTISGPSRRHSAEERWMIRAATEQKHPVLLEYAKASFKRIKQRLRHLWALACVKRVLTDNTLASDLDRQFRDVLVGYRKVRQTRPAPREA